jgi:beta-lactamase regulating signal transducer with metallopeptidase domain
MNADRAWSVGLLVLDWSVRAAFVGVGVGLVLALGRVRQAAVRHAAWTVVLAAMVSMPLLPRLVPAVGWPLVAPVARSAAADEATSSPRVLPGAVAATPVSRPLAEVSAPDPVPKPRAPSAPATWPHWPAAALTLWAVVALPMILRLATGWLALWRLAAMATPVGAATGAAARVRSSRAVAAPVVAGVIAPTVLVPEGWSRWPDETRAAVLAHELAHLRRRDPLVMLVARVNRCLFWFHPLAWWLERTLASTAEEACDAAAVRAVREPRRYAAALVEMARAVAASGRRVDWRGVGIEGTGPLERRIDRVLAGAFGAQVGVARRAAVALGCVLTVALVVACRPQNAGAPVPLRPDPRVSADMARDHEREAAFDAAAALTAPQVAALEAAVQKNPDDLPALRQLGIFYRFSGPKVVGWDATVAARRRHIVWLIEHHPGHRVLLDWGPIYPAHDAAGYAEAKEAWLAQVSRDARDVEVLGNAAYFFQVTDKPLAENLLQKASAVDPGGPTPPVVDGVYFASWASRLGSVYAGALLGLMEGSLTMGIQTVSREEAHGAYATEVRRKLDRTQSADVLSAVADELGRVGRSVRDRLDFDPLALARSYLERARQLEPDKARVRTLIVRMQVAERDDRAHLLLRAVPRERQVTTILGLPEDDRFDLLPRLAEEQYVHAEYAEWTLRDQGTATELDGAKRYAEDLLALAARRTRHPHFASAAFAAHMTLAALALHANDTATALAHLRSAADVPPSEELEYSHDLLWPRVCGGLLKRGERESVAGFLDAYAARCLVQRDQLATSAASIRAGVMPDWQQMHYSAANR